MQPRRFQLVDRFGNATLNPEGHLLAGETDPSDAGQTAPLGALYIRRFVSGSSVEFVGTESALADTCDLPTFEPGDLAIVFAHRDGSNTSPGLASGWTTIGLGGGNDNALRIAGRRLVAGDTTIGTWNNATSVQVIVLRGARSGSTVGDAIGGVSLNNGGDGDAITYPTLTLTRDDGSSWIVAAAGHRTATDMHSQAVTGMTNRSNGQDATDMSLHTAEEVTAWSATAFDGTVNASSGWRARTIEVLGDDNAAELWFKYGPGDTDWTLAAGPGMAFH